MPQIPTELLNSIGMVLEVVVAGLTALFVAFWLGLVIWTFRDIRSRTRDLFAWLLAVLLVLIGGPIGWLLYFLLRPRETLAAAYDRQLEEEALLRDITVRRACPSCQTVTEPDWQICPRCEEELRRACVSCGRLLDLDWVACPFCTAAVETVKSKGKALAPAKASAPVAQLEPVDEPVADSYYDQTSGPVSKVKPVAGTVAE